MQARHQPSSRNQYAPIGVNNITGSSIWQLSRSGFVQCLRSRERWDILTLTMAVTTILFDLDDTLIADEAVSKEAMREAAAFANQECGVDAEVFVRDATSQAKRLWKAGPCYSYCHHIGISAMECLWGPFEGESDETTRLREWAGGYRPLVFEQALGGQLIEPGDAGSKIARVFREARRRLQRPLPNAYETLVVLKRHFKLGLLTNGDSSLQREKLKASGFASFFDSVVISGELGIGKPRREIFEHLLSSLSSGPQEAMMVGNSLERDIVGAHYAGIHQVVWIKIPGSEEPADTEPHHTITGLHEVPELAGVARV